MDINDYFKPTVQQVATIKSNIKRGKSNTGPFCSKTCSGKVNN